MKKSSIFFLVFIILLTSCSKIVQEIDWNPEEVPNKLIVEGSISNEPGLHPLSLKRSDAYFSNSPSPMVSGASISLISGSSVFEYLEDPENPGFYYMNEPITGTVNQEFTLNITLDEELDGSSEFTATSAIIEGMRIDSISADLYTNPVIFGDNDSLVLVLLIYGEEPVEFINYYLMKLYRNNSLLSDTIIDYPVFKDIDNGMNGESILGFMFTTTEFSPGDTLSLELVSIPKDFKIFLDGVNQISQPGDPFGFAGPPANAVGNINQGNALGFYYGAFVAHGKSVVVDRR